MKRPPFLLEEWNTPYLAELHEVDMKDVPLPKGVIMRVRGQAHHSGKVTSNATLYGTDLYQRETARLVPEMESGEVLMYPRHPKIEKTPDGKVLVESMKPTESAALLRNLEVLPDGWVVLEADIGEMDEGRNIAALVRMGAKVPISSRARGTATRTKLTDKHPAAKENSEWIGKEVNIINEDFQLITFDFVSKAASGGSQTISWREEDEEEVMDFDVKKLTDEQWKSIAESDHIKKLIEDAVKVSEVSLNKKFEDESMKRIKDQVAEAMKDPAVIKEILEKAKAETDSDPEVVECKFCKGPVLEGMQFCPSCGRLLTEAKKPETETEKDEAIKSLKTDYDALKKSNDDMAKKLEAMEDKDKKAEKKVKAESDVEEVLKGKPAYVIEQVRADMATRELTEENAKTLCEASVKRVEDMVKVFGVKLEDIPTGKGTTGEGEGDPKKPTLTEDAKNQQSTLSRI